MRTPECWSIHVYSKEPDVVKVVGFAGAFPTFRGQPFGSLVDLLTGGGSLPHAARCHGVVTVLFGRGHSCPPAG